MGKYSPQKKCGNGEEHGLLELEASLVCGAQHGRERPEHTGSPGLHQRFATLVRSTARPRRVL